MSNKAADVAKQMSAVWSQLSLVKRVVIGLVTLGVLGAVLWISTAGSREPYAPLYAEIGTDDAAQVAQKLKELKVPFQVEGGGNTILVPESQVYTLRLELASSGLPRGGGVGFELFDQPKLGATEFEQQVNLRRALEGELTRSIATIDGVQAARVHLVLPEHRLFVSDQQSASASVVLKLRNGANFGKREVAATVHLVATAVPGLSRERISVVSTDGTTLHRPSDDGEDSGGLDDSRTERERETGQRLEDHVRGLVERVVGEGNADVRVSVSLDTSSRERTEEHFGPGEPILRSEFGTEEFTGAQAPAGVAGVPGAVSNLPNPAASGSAAATAPSAPPGGNLFRRSYTKNWEMDRVTEKTKLPSGTIKRLGVAVLINGKLVQKDVIAPSGATLGALGDVIKNAVGFDAARGDTFSIDAAPFAKPKIDPPAPVAPPASKLLRYAPSAGAAVAALLIGLIALGMLRGGRRRADASVAALTAGAVPGLLGAGAAPQLPVSDERRLPAAGAEHRAQTRSRALEIAAQDPATTAVVLRGWLNATSKGSAPRA